MCKDKRSTSKTLYVVSVRGGQNQETTEIGEYCEKELFRFVGHLHQLPEEPLLKRLELIEEQYLVLDALVGKSIFGSKDPQLTMEQSLMALCDQTENGLFLKDQPA